MDPTQGSKKAPPAAAAGDVVPSAGQHAAEQSSSPEPDAAVAVTGAKASDGGEDDDEQVERFYALLDNIRAMRGMISTTSGTATGRKRARDAEPPWRPAFRMEDFELEKVDSDSPGCAGKKKLKRENSAKRPADDEEQRAEDEVVEAKGHPRRGQPQPQPQPQPQKARPAGVLAVDT